MKRIISIFAVGLGSNMLCAETTITDSYNLAGRVATVVGIRSAEGKWSSPPYKLQIGLEPLGKKKPTQIAEYKIVVDASKLEGQIPGPCVKKFSVPWVRVAKKFTEGMPEEEEKDRRQKYELGAQGGCAITLWVDIIRDFRPETVTQKFPGLSLAKAIDLKTGRVEFASEGQTSRIDFVVEHKDLPTRDETNAASTKLPKGSEWHILKLGQSWNGIMFTKVGNDAIAYFDKTPIAKCVVGSGPEFQVDERGYSENSMKEYLENTIKEAQIHISPASPKKQLIGVFCTTKAESYPGFQLINLETRSLVPLLPAQGKLEPWISFSPDERYVVVNPKLPDDGVGEFWSYVIDLETRLV